MQHVSASFAHYQVYALMLKLLHCHLSMLHVNIEIDFCYSR
jgi:hypothetical protein